MGSKRSLGRKSKTIRGREVVEWRRVWQRATISGTENAKQCQKSYWGQEKQSGVKRDQLVACVDKLEETAALNDDQIGSSWGITWEWQGSREGLSGVRRGSSGIKGKEPEFNSSRSRNPCFPLSLSELWLTIIESCDVFILVRSTTRTPRTRQYSFLFD